ncbi:helix-turn-helix domain-containing protein [Kitasatospora griseola]|uniref:helix-turn-helix domain-containing protein n=1 Tax=Kitasatospora griseola TaxID=2064 RepID=UPI003446A5A7
MVAKAREIVAAGSAQARLGAELRRRRTSDGFSLAKLGAAVHCSPDLVRRIEETERFPARELIEACDRVLGAEGALVALWPAVDSERRHFRPVTSGRATGSGPARFAPEASNALIASWAASEGRWARRLR